MRADPASRDLALATMALAALGLGLLVYLADRDAGHAWLQPTVQSLAGRRWFGTAASWLPSALHAFGFALLSAVLLPQRVLPRALACTGWVAIDLAFELGQHAAFAAPLAAWLESATPAALAGPLARYFRAGTFDPADLGATLLGGAAALTVALHALHHQEPAHAR